MILLASWVDRVSAHLRVLISCVSLSSPLAMSIATFPQPSGYLSRLLPDCCSYYNNFIIHPQHPLSGPVWTAYHFVHTYQLLIPAFISFHPLTGRMGRLHISQTHVLSYRAHAGSEPSNHCQGALSRSASSSFVHHLISGLRKAARGR